jgi:mitochondrial fission protein ELM1
VTDNTCDEPDGVMDQESAYLSMLATAGRLVETARSIELLTEDGTPLFMYHGE